MKDTYIHKGLRNRLIKTLEEKGIKNKAVLRVMNEIPRHLFISDSAFHKHAYDDIAFPIGENQTISQPYTVAYQSTLLEVQKRDKILEIGTGSGYQAAVLSKLGARVYSIERQKTLFLRTASLLIDLGFGLIKTFYGDGYKGLPQYAPFDKIIITAAAPEIPKALLEQLKVGGMLVIPLGKGKIQKMLRIIKKDEQTFTSEQYDNFSFVPMLKGISGRSS